MKLTINSKDLLKSLNTVGTLIKQTSIPALENIHFDLKPGKLFLTADNLEVRSTLELDVNFDAEHVTLIPYAYLVSVLKGFANAPVDIIFKDKEVHISQGTSLYKIPLIPEDVKKFPESKVGEQEFETILNSLDLVEALKKAYQFADKSMSDSLSTVLLWVRDKDVRVVGCSQYLFYEETIKGSGEECKILLPLSAAQYIMNTIEAEEDIKIHYGGNHILISMDNRTISTILYNGKYSSYEIILEKIQTDRGLNIDKETILPALKRILSITDKNSFSVVFDFKPKKLEMRFSHIAFRTEAKEDIEIDFTGEDTVISLNPYNLNNIFNSIDGNIKMEFSNTLQQAIITSENIRCLCAAMMN